MPAWKIQLTSRAQHDLDAIKKENPAYYPSLIEDIQSLAKNPFPKPPKGKKLRGRSGVLWRLRSGDYRAIYRPKPPKAIILLCLVARKDLERLLKHF